MKSTWTTLKETTNKLDSIKKKYLSLLPMFKKRKQQWELNCLEEPRTNRNEIIVKGACNNRPRPRVSN